MLSATGSGYDEMASDQPHQPSHLFTVRLWAEALGDDQHEYRGKVQHVVSGDACHFRDWATMEAFMKEKLRATGHVFQINQTKEETRATPARSDERTRHP